MKRTQRARNPNAPDGGARTQGACQTKRAPKSPPSARGSGGARESRPKPARERAPSGTGRNSPKDRRDDEAPTNQGGACHKAQARAEGEGGKTKPPTDRRANPRGSSLYNVNRVILSGKCVSIGKRMQIKKPFCHIA